jgi:hypothetical protein
MQNMVFALLFLATAPIGLLPAILALFLHHPGATWVAVANLAIWAGPPLFQTIGFPLHISVVGALLIWLVLLRAVLVRSPGGAR